MIRAFFSIVAGFVVSAVIAYGVALAAVGGAFERGEPAHADVAVVLGAAVWPGGAPSPALTRRALRAGRLFRNGRVDWIATTGGVGAHGGASEGETAAALIARHDGIDPARILVEHASHSTLENLAYVRPLLRAHGLRRLFVVSDAYHLARGVTIGRDLGFEAWGVPADGSNVALAALAERKHSAREALLLLGYLARPYDIREEK